MHILIIPSWYPFSKNLYSGIFIHEQALAIGQMAPQHQISLSLWGQKEFNLQIRRPVQSLKTIGTFCMAKPYEKALVQNVSEYYIPCLSWYHSIAGGNIKRILKTNVQNYQNILKDHGKIDLIHAHASYPAGYVALYLARQFKIPYMITEHMSPHSFSFYSRQGVLQPWVAEPLKQANQLITVSPVVDVFLRDHNMPESHVIPNCIDETFFVPEILSGGADTFTFFTAARITHQKGLDELLHAAKEVVKQYPKTRFRIAGHGSHLKAFKSLSRQLGISDIVQWLGALDRESLLKEYQNCDCFVLPSYSETFGVVYIEAMACGKPVIATRCGGPESFVHSGNGILVEKRNIASLFQGMKEMLDKGRGYYDAETIRKDFLFHYSRKAIIPKILDIYQEFNPS